LKITGNVIPTPNKLRASIGNLKLDKTKIPLKNILNTEIVKGQLKLHSNFKETVHISFELPDSYLEIIPNDFEMEPDERITINYNYNAVIKQDLGNFFDKIPVFCKTASSKKNGYVYFTGSIKEDFSSLTEIERKNAPHIKLNTYVIDLGELDLQTKKLVEIPVMNTGKSDLIIRKVETSRYCELLEYNGTIEPESEGIIKLQVNPYISRKSFNTDFTLICNDPDKPVLKVRLTGKIKE
jgi:HYDIN/CFA65/VesB family protein